MQPEPEADRVLDIRGDICPYTFVRTKLALEEMESGQVLKVIVDYLPATVSVPRSTRLEGHQVLTVKQVDGTDWIIVIRKA